MKQLTILTLLVLCISGCSYFRHDKLPIGVWETAPENLLPIFESQTIIFWEQFKWTSPLTGKYIPYRTELSVINGCTAPVTFKMTKMVDEAGVKYYDTDKKYDFLMEQGGYYVIDSIGNLHEYNNHGHISTYKVTESINIGIKNLKF